MRLSGFVNYEIRPSLGSPSAVLRSNFWIAAMRRAAIWKLILGASALVIASYVAWSWHFSLPTIARSLPSNFGEAHEVFHKRVRVQFPPGAREEDLIHELRALGFGEVARTPNSNFVQIDRGGFSCNYLWRVIWNTDSDGRTSNLRGLYGATCL